MGIWDKSGASVIGDLALQVAPTIALIAAGGYIVLLALLARKRGLPGAAERWFAGYLLLSALWTVAWALANLWKGLSPATVDWGHRMIVYAAALLTPALAVLTFHFLPRRGAREVTWLGIAWALAVILVERRVIDLSWSETALDGLRVIGWAGFLLGSVALTGFEYLRLRRPLHRNRVLYWLVALLLITLGEGLHYFHNESLAELGLPLRLLGAMMMTYALLTYSLPDLKSVGRRALLAATVTLVRALLYLVAIMVAVIVYRSLESGDLEGGQQLWLALVAALGGALLLALLQVPVHRIVSGAAERLLFGPGYDVSRALRDYSQSISNILEIQRLARVAVEAIAGALEVGQGALLLITTREDGGADVRVIPGMGHVAAMDVALAPASPVLRTLKGSNRPLTQYDIDMLPEFRAIAPDERQWQWALDVEVYVPIHSKGDLIGALALGAKQTGEPYTAQDLDVLNTLAGQTAVALENARLFDDQRRLNEEISQLNEELITVNTRLAKLDKAKSDFLNITSHELRTPLTQVRGYADILGEITADAEVDPDYTLTITTSIRKAADRLEAIYSAMLDVSAIGVDELHLHFEPVRPSVFVLHAVAKWQGAFEQRQQTLVVKGIEELPSLEGDSERLMQAFSNLINNAIKFTPDGGRIEVSGRAVQGPEPVIEIVVADEGIGIDPADQVMIFERFYRAGSVDLHSTGNIKFKGAGPGLGLPIALGVIEGHGGRIWVESDGCDEENCPGSRFHVLLPLRQGLTDPERVVKQLGKTRPMGGLPAGSLAKAESDENAEQL
jgi:signal transduction histidine kinase